MAADKPRNRFVFRKKRLLVVATLLALGGLMWFIMAKHEPLHKCKRISYWVDQACRGYDSSPAYNARFEITNIGPAAVPYLVKRLRTSDRWRGIWFSIQAHLPSQFQTGITNNPLPGEMRYGAARTLGLLGSAAKPAVSALIPLLPRTDVPAIETLTGIGPAAKDALPALRSLLCTTPGMSRRVQIAGALWQIGHETNLVLQVCTNALAPNSGDDGINACAYLMQLGRAAAPAVPVALALLQDANRHEGARGNAANLLGAAQISSPGILTALVEGTKSENPNVVRSCCAMALWRFDRQYAPLATRVELQYIVSEKYTPVLFARWLKFYGLDPEDCMPTLTALLHDNSEDIRKAAALALETIEAQSKLDAKQ